MAKKDFKQKNPALAFISPQEEDELTDPAPAEEKKQTAEEPTAPEGYKLNPEYVELKSKRVQLLLQPSVVSAVKDLAKEEGKSMNEVVNEAIKAYLKKERGK